MASITVTLDVPANSHLAKAIALGGVFTVEGVALLGKAVAEGSAVHFDQRFDAIAGERVAVTP